MPHTPRRLPLFALAVAAVALARPCVTHAAPALADTGLFATVARQYGARMERLKALAAGPVTAERIRLLLATGQADAAVKLAPRLTTGGGDDARAARVAEIRARLGVQDFAGSDALVQALAAETAPGAHERSAHYAWLIACDDEATVDRLTRQRLARVQDERALPEWLAAGRLAYDRLDYPRAESCFARARDLSPLPASVPAWGSEEGVRRAAALTGLALVQQKRRQWDASLATLQQALDADASPLVLNALTETLIRLGRTDESVSTGEWGVKLDPWHDPSHYLLGNGYARKNYTQLFAAYPARFADAAGRARIAAADAQLAAGRRAAARAAYAALVAAHPGWVDARVRLASLDFEDGRFEAARDGCFAALRTCPEYGRAHAVLAKALEGQRFAVDVHRTDYEKRFAAAPMPDVPGIEKFVANWKALSPRHQKRVALSVAPWKAFIPVLVAGGATYYIKPVYMLLSDCPNLETLRDTRINYDSRLWDDVRGCGGYHTVTGIEDVERTIFDRYNTVLHELTHQVHAILTADDSRVIQEHYRRAKERDDKTKDGYLSRYAGGSVFEYFAEGANSLLSPMRDAYDPREVVRERLDRIDPDLKVLVQKFMARTDVSSSYPIAYSAGGDDRIERGKVAEAVPLYRKALGLEPDNETALVSLTRALVLGNRAAEAETVAARAVASHAASGPARTGLADAAWHAGRGLDVARTRLARGRASVRSEDRYQVDQSLGGYAWVAGDAAGALAAYDSVVAYQSDNPEGLQGRANALALAKRWDEAFPAYDKAVRMRTGVVGLRCDYARDLLRAGRIAEAKSQLDEAKLLDEENPTAEALRAWADLASGSLASARAHARRALAWGPWCDLASIVSGAIEAKAGNAAAAKAAWAPVRDRIAKSSPPGYVYRRKLAAWELTHALPAVEREMLPEASAAN